MTVDADFANCTCLQTGTHHLKASSSKSIITQPTKKLLEKFPPCDTIQCPKFKKGDKEEESQDMKQVLHPSSS